MIIEIPTNTNEPLFLSVAETPGTQTHVLVNHKTFTPETFEITALERVLKMINGTSLTCSPNGVLGFKCTLFGRIQILTNGLAISIRYSDIVWALRLLADYRVRYAQNADNVAQ